MASLAILSLAALAGAQTTIGRGPAEWSVAYQKAQALVSQMTLGEMNNMTYGQPSTVGCSGVSGSVPRLGFPGLCLQDAGNGVRGTDGVNAYASGVHVGASFNKDLAHARGQFMGAEFKRKGVNVALGPVVGPLGRTAEGGRNWEGFGADAYLDGILGHLTVAGLQESVITSVKHYVGNEQEFHRGPINGTLSLSSNISDEALHELYLWPFEDTIQAGAGCVMCSYNRINGTYGCEDDHTLREILKGELQFKGFIVTDWGAQHSGLKSAKAGLDMVMPSSTFWANGSLEAAISNGSLSRTRLEDMATRIVASWYLLGQDSPNYPAIGVGMPKNISLPHEFIDARDPQAKDTLYQGAVEGHVLVKNTGSLPLNKPKIMSIFGYDATAPLVGTPSLTSFGAGVLDYWSLGWANLNLTGITFSQFIYGDLSPPSFSRTLTGTQFTGGGSGSNTPAYLSTPYEALSERAYADGTFLYHNFESFSPSVPESDVCLVFVNDFASEGFDRNGLADQESDDLIEHVASQCNNTVVVIHNAGVRTARWIDNTNITAVIYAHLPGQDSGRAISAILHGDVSPSGRLPYTVPKQAEDYGELLHPCYGDNSTMPSCEFSEGVNIDYRGFLSRNVEPLYAFGYGLTYSNFSYSDLEIHTNISCKSNSSSLFDTVGYVSAHVKNTGDVQASEVAQLYIERPGYVRALRGFEKLSLTPGEGATANFMLRRKDLSVWSTGQQRWTLPCGESKVYVGKSVLDVPLTGSIQL